MGYLRDIEKLIRVALPREDRRTPGTRDAAPAPSQNRGARAAPRGGHSNGHGHGHGHSAGGRSHEAAPGSKGPRRPRRGGGNNAAPQPTRHESPRPAQQGGKSQAGQSEGIQGVAFLP